MMEIMMNEVKWLIETIGDDEQEKELIERLIHKEYDTRIVKWNLFQDKFDLEIPCEWNDDGCVVCRGSIGFISKIQRSRKWIPGTYARFNNFRCQTYYPWYRDFLLNDQYFMIPFGSWEKNPRLPFKLFGIETLFVRPDTGKKTFTGNECSAEYAECFVGTLKHSVYNEDLILFAPSKKIKREWRFFCHEEEGVLTGSQYREGERIFMKESCLDDEVFKYASEIFRGVDFKPDIFFSMDICETDEGLRLLELNSFSCCGLYRSNIDVLIDAVSRHALEEHEMMKSA